MCTIFEIITWYEKMRRWSLRFLLSIPLAFLLCKFYFEFSFREAIWHWLFWIISGISIAISGILDNAKFPQKIRGLWPSGFLTLCGVACLIVGILQLRPPTLPADKLVVTIARFTPISTGAEEDADNFRHRIELKLLEKAHAGAPLIIKHTSRRVKGSNGKARQKDAEKIGKAKESYAHVVLWGEVRRDEGELFVGAYLAISNKLRGMPLVEKELGEFYSYEPHHLEFKKRFSEEFADITLFIYGLSFYKIGDWYRSADILEHVKSEEAYFYRGLALYNIAQQALKPDGVLQAAVEALEQIQWDPKTNAGSLTWVAYSNRANALVSRALISQPSESIVYLREAKSAYDSLLKSQNLEHLPQYWAKIQNNLGIALNELSFRIGGEDGKKLLFDAEKAYRAALQVHSPNDQPQEWSRSQSNLGNVLYELGTLLGGDEERQLLLDAESVYRAALKIITLEKWPQDWAMIQHNLGAVFYKVGIQMKNEEGTRYLLNSVSSYRAALQVSSKEDTPRDWAETQSNLGNVLDDLGLRIGGREGVLYFRQSVAAHDSALQIYTKDGYPVQWALVHYNQGNTVDNLGRHMKGEKGNQNLRIAKDHYELALHIFTKEHLPEYWAMAKRNLANTLYHLGRRIEGKEKQQLLMESLRHINNAFSVHDSTNYPREYRKLITLKAEVMRSLDSLEETSFGI